MANNKKKGAKYMRELARLGGLKTLKNRGLHHYSTIGKEGNKAMRKVLSTSPKHIA